MNPAALAPPDVTMFLEQTIPTEYWTKLPTVVRAAHESFPQASLCEYMLQDVKGDVIKQKITRDKRRYQQRYILH